MEIFKFKVFEEDAPKREGVCSDNDEDDDDVEIVREE